MQIAQNSMIAIRVSDIEKKKFKLLSELENKSVSQVVKELVDRELKTRKLSALEIRKLPKQSRTEILKQMTEIAMPLYNKYKNELEIEETGDGIE